MAKLIVVFKNKIMQEVKLAKETVRIGRDFDNEIQIDNPGVSRFHAEIYRQGYPFYLEDMKSTNGTYINGSFVSWKVALSDGDRITIGKHDLVFQLEASDYREGKKKIDFGETVCIRPENKRK